MIDGKRIVAWTPYGRQATASILAEYLKRDHAAGLVDEWWLCMNTDADQFADRVWGYELEEEHDWIKALERPSGCRLLKPKQRNTGYFYRYMTDFDTVYVRLDDDIVYVHPDAIERLVRHKLQTPGSVASFPIMWNNAVISWYLQKAGIIPESYGQVGGPYCMDPMGWANGEFAVKIHNYLLDCLDDPETNNLEGLYLYQDMPLKIGMQFSVSCFASLGTLYGRLANPGVLVPDEEESWHTVHQPRQLGQPNMIVGNALVSHYSFFPQRAHLARTDVLDRYRALAEKVNS